jgi:hypothetical protein
MAAFSRRERKPPAPAPAAYDPARSIGQAIQHLATAQRQGEVLGELVEAYPGMLRYEGQAGSTTFNPVREQFRRIVTVPHSIIAARAYLDFLRRFSIRLKGVFPDNYAAEKKPWMTTAPCSKRSLRSI